MNIPSPAEVFAALFGAAPEPGPEGALEYYGPCDRVAIPEPEAVNDPWKPCIDAGRAAGEAEAWVPDYGASDSLWQRVEVPAAEPEPEAEL